MPWSASDLLALWFVLLAGAVCAALLWSAVTLAHEADLSVTNGRAALAVTATGLLAAAVWWPAFEASRAHGSGTLSWPHGALILAAGVALAQAARYGARQLWHSRQALLGAALTLLAAVALLSVLFALPGTGWALGIGAPLALAFPLAASLRALHHAAARPLGWQVQLPALVTACAVVVAITYRTPQAAVAWAGELLPILAMAAMAVVMALLLRHGRRARGHAVRGGDNPGWLDPLTGLPNRGALEARMARLLNGPAAERRFALLLINLDGFKPVNATYGHQVGDQLLKQASQRLRRQLRPRDFLARLSADEFALLRLEATDDPKAHVKAAEQVIASLAPPYKLGSREIGLSASIGIALHPDHGDVDRLLALGDAAMRFAKRAGGGRASLFSAEMERDLADDLDLLRDLRRALEQDEFELVFQPKIDAASGQITAAEALLRWRHPQRGEIAPTVFVAIAERYGLVSRLGDWVIENACRQARVWADRGLHMRVAINLSAQHMRQRDLASRIASALARYRIDPTRLTCEITESLAMEHTQATQATFAALGEAGVHLSIDDFGTGYSSLAYLRKLPASEIKIDRSFVMDLERSADARAIVDAVVKLAHALGKRVVAEGVETMRQRRILTELGCDELQGFLFAKPMSAQDLLAWALDDQQRDEQTFRKSLYVQPDERVLREREKASPSRVH